MLQPSTRRQTPDARRFHLPGSGHDSLRRPPHRLRRLSVHINKEPCRHWVPQMLGGTSDAQGQLIALSPTETRLEDRGLDRRSAACHYAALGRRDCRCVENTTTLGRAASCVLRAACCVHADCRLATAAVRGKEGPTVAFAITVCGCEAMDNTRRGIGGVPNATALQDWHLASQHHGQRLQQVVTPIQGSRRRGEEEEEEEEEEAEERNHVSCEAIAARCRPSLPSCAVLASASTELCKVSGFCSSA
jgi:hypothetical protein